MTDMKAVHLLWVLISSALVIFMQVGFLFIESGLTRAKNSINVAVKNICDFGIASVIYWALGFGLMFGYSQAGLWGMDYSLVNFGRGDFEKTVFFIFQLSFCATCVTIVSGAVAERLHFSAYLLNALFMSALIYPIVGHWIWGGAFLEEGGQGWLASLGFVDFAGSIVVHAVGGSVALAILFIIGSRKGRFPTGKHPRKINGCNLPLATGGAIILWVGWFGFNGGSAGALDESVPGILMNTYLAACMALITALFYSWFRLGYPDAAAPLNGSLGGLVAITACCHVVTSGQALWIGGLAGIIVMFSAELLAKMKIDDAVDAISVHTSAGIWGALCVGLFGDLELLGTGLSRGEQISIQLIGSIVCCFFAFLLTLIVFSIINFFRPLRVSMEDEQRGLNFTEHRARTDLVDLLDVMEYQYRSGDLRARAAVEPFTDIGQIAQHYNRVQEKVRSILMEKEAARKDLELALEAKKKAEKVLLNTLPAPVAASLMENRNVHAHSSEVTVIFADIVGFTKIAECYPPQYIIKLLNTIFSELDTLLETHRLEKVKTAGDSYMAVGGLLHLIDDHTSAAAAFCLDALDRIGKIHFGKDAQERIQVRIGMNSGKVVAGVIGLKNFVYDVWGDAVNVASRMESYALPNTIQLTEETAHKLQDKFILEKRGYIDIKGKGKLLTYFLKGRKESKPAPILA